MRKLVLRNTEFAILEVTDRRTREVVGHLSYFRGFDEQPAGFVFTPSFDKPHGTHETILEALQNRLGNDITVEIN